MNGITELAKLLKERENSDGYSPMFGTVIELPNTKIRISDKVIIINSEKGVASEELINEVKTHIEENRPIGAEVTVESAAPLTINVSAKLTLANGASFELAKEKITESITKYLQKNAFSVGYISYAQIGGCILACDEIANYSNLKLNNDTQNITVSETQVPVLGVVTVD